MQKRRGGRRLAVASFLVVFGGLLASGVVMLFTRTPDEAATRSANNGFTLARSAEAEPIQLMHEALSDLMFVIVLIGAGWLMVRVKEDWSGLLGLAVGATLLTVLSGWLVRFDAVRLAGAFTEDVRGYGFLFDGDLEEVVLAKRRLGPGAFRLWVAVHLVSSVATVVLAWFGYKSALRPPEIDRWDPGWLEELRERQARDRARGKGGR